MKHILIFIILRVFLANAQTEDDNPIQDALDFQKELNAEYANPHETPLLPEDLAKFKALDFYPVNEKFIFEVVIKRTPQAIPFMMKRTKDEVKYVKYGEVTFKYNGQNHTLAVYQNLDLIARKPEYSNYLFLPFTDATNGETTYGGGRYLDLKIPENKTVVINFNKAYNPLCHYNKKFSCPIPPIENDLGFRVEAGVKKYRKH